MTALLLLHACGSLAPEGTRFLAVPTTGEATVTWTAEGAEELWIGLDVDGGRSLCGPVRVEARGQEIVSGTFSSDHGRILERRGSYKQNWVSTPLGVSGDAFLFDLEVEPGTPMSATVDLDAPSGSTVVSLELQVRPEGAGLLGFLGL